MIQKTLIIHFLRTQNEKYLSMEPEPPGAAFFCLKPEPTQFGRSQSQSRLRDLGLPEPPKKVWLRNTVSNGSKVIKKIFNLAYYIYTFNIVRSFYLYSVHCHKLNFSIFKNCLLATAVSRCEASFQL